MCCFSFSIKEIHDIKAQMNKHGVKEILSQRQVAGKWGASGRPGRVGFGEISEPMVAKINLRGAGQGSKEA